MNASSDSALHGAAEPARAAAAAASAPTGAAPAPVQRLCDLMDEGWHLVLLLRSGQAPESPASFRAAVLRFLQDFERQAQRLGGSVSAEDIHLSKYAFCALLDEVVLGADLGLREVWELRPLQLECFGDQLAGDQFFVHLETLRREGERRLPALEVFQMCLLLGFQGLYRLEGREKLAYLIARLGDEVQRHQGGRREFAPNWRAPDRVVHLLRTDVPVWAVASVFALLGLLGYLALQASLKSHTRQQLQAYQQLVQMPPRTGYLTITLP